MTREACTTAWQQVSAMFANAGCPGCMARSAARSPQYRGLATQGASRTAIGCCRRAYYGDGCDLREATTA